MESDLIFDHKFYSCDKSTATKLFLTIEAFESSTNHKLGKFYPITNFLYIFDSKNGRIHISIYQYIIDIFLSSKYEGGFDDMYHLEFCVLQTDS